MSQIKYVINNAVKQPGEGAALDILSQEQAEKARKFHSGFAQYSPTPLVPLTDLAEHFGLGGLWIKDESFRFGLNAFKVLGASYAMGRYMADRLGCDIGDTNPVELCSEPIRHKLGPITFTTATDGNHGRAVAWTAEQMHQKAVVYMPKGSDPTRLANIQFHKAEASITDLNYDDAVRLSNKMAQEHGWIMVQDTAWEGYENIPTWIMQGYTTLAVEAMEQLRAMGTVAPTHIFLQAGVGSFASAVLGCMAAALGKRMPTAVVVEPNAADCIYQSALANDGKPHNVGGDLSTLMAGLACGEPNTIGWPILRDYAKAYMSCPDYIAANGMRILASPLRDDKPIVAGESGAATCGALQYIMQHPDGAELRRQLGLGPGSRVLLISTEGDTSPDMYRKVIWFGSHNDPAVR